MSSNEELQKLFESLEDMLENQTLTKEKLVEFWENVSSLAEQEEDVDKDLLETMKDFVMKMTEELDAEALQSDKKGKLSRAPRDTRGNSHRSVSGKVDEAQASKFKPMLVLWTGFFVGTAVSYKFYKKPLNPIAKTVLTTFAAKASEKGFDKAYEEFQSMLQKP